MKSICIITVYFGQFPNYFNLWVSSCERNNSIDFKIVTDQSVERLPKNVSVIKMELASFKALAEKRIGKPIRLETPYKCCDYKPMYGLILEDYLSCYDFWGHCDIDLIFGDLRNFVTDSILAEFDKIYHLGHLSLYRNTFQINNAFRLDGSKRANYCQVIRTDKICVFDERYGIDMIFKQNNLPMYSKIEFADIDFCLERLTAVGLKNYNYQLFCCFGGKCYRYYVDEGLIRRDEFAYIHLQKRKFKNTLKDTEYYAITPNEFVRLQGDIQMSIIKELNPFHGTLYERIEHVLKSYRFRITRKLKGTHL